jgi:hypothetical protein
MVRVRVGDKSLYETEAPDAIEKFNPREEVRVREELWLGLELGLESGTSLSMRL